jgi:hypothetical protein
LKGVLAEGGKIVTSSTSNNLPGGNNFVCGYGNNFGNNFVWGYNVNLFRLVWTIYSQ